ncbi:hypothetical protein [Nocardia sp. CC201C]|uniref:DUF7171 family protein n=1 Tax=Nocardia sp. CC201C TaxID=3044575 RepID=UPI0024A95D58|nr:hypothetical protein [Nocardia sp. CC201C]
MAKVITHNGVKGGTAEGFTRYRFSGSPTDQFEHRGEVGELRRMTVTVECVAEGYDQINDGVRHQTKWRVLEASLGDPVERPADPELPFDDEDQAEGDAYGDYSEPDASPGGTVAFSDRGDTAD